VLAQVAVKIESIDDRDRPRARKIYDLAGVIEQSDRVGLGEAVQSIEKKMVNLLGPQSQPELMRVDDAGGKNHPLRFLDDQIDRLNCPCGLLGKHDGEVLRVLGLVRDPLAVQIPDRNPGSNDRDCDKKETTEE
jgi:hypothetical protein